LTDPKQAKAREAEAIERAKQGDEAAFETLYHLHKRRVYSLCLRMVSNPAQAEDLAQEAFLQLFRKIGTFRGESAFSTWLHRMTVNVVLMNAFLSFPGILLAIAFVAFRGPGILNLVLALSLGGWVGYARLVRGQVLAAREKEFVEAARALGASDLRIIVRHILPNIIQPVIVQSAIGMAGAILAEATMSFLGLGVPPPTASWGTMLNDGRAHLFDAPHLVLFPALAVMLAVLSFNFIGDALRDYLDPRSRIEAGM